MRRNLQKSNPALRAADMTEGNLLAAAKRLAVKEETKLAHRIKMGRALQSPGSSVRTYHSHLKGSAAHCRYQITHHCTCGRDSMVDYSDEVIQDQLVKGLADQEILADLLGDEKADRTTDQIVEFIARKEQAKLERGTVVCESTSAVGQAPKPAKSRICRGCKGPEHDGNWQKRREVCPIRDSVCDKRPGEGHYSSACVKCKDCSEWGHSNKQSKHCEYKSKSSTNQEKEVRVSSVPHSSAATAELSRRAKQQCGEAMPSSSVKQQRQAAAPSRSAQ